MTYVSSTVSIVILYQVFSANKTSRCYYMWRRSIFLPPVSRLCTWICSNTEGTVIGQIFGQSRSVFSQIWHPRPCHSSWHFQQDSRTRLSSRLLRSQPSLLGTFTSSNGSWNPDPSGWSQAIVYGVLHKWGINGYLEWLITLRGQYQIRRNWICDAIEENFEVRPAEPKNLLGAEGLAVYFKGSAGSKSQPVFSFVPPTGGMYIWARFYLAECPRFQTLQREAVTDPEKTFADELWSKMAENLVIAPPPPPFASLMLIDMIGPIDSWLVFHPLARKWKNYNEDEGRGAGDWKFSIGLLYNYCESWIISLISKKTLLTYLWYKERRNDAGYQKNGWSPGRILGVVNSIW